MEIIRRSTPRKDSRRVLDCVVLVAISMVLRPPLALGTQCRDLAVQEVTAAGSVEWTTASTQPYYSFKADGTVFVREKTTHREVLKFEGHKGDSGAAMHPDQPRMLIEGSYRSFQMRELPSGKAVGPVIEAHRAAFVDDRFLDLWRFFDRTLQRSIVEAHTGREVLRIPWFVAERVTPERTLLAHPAADARQLVVLDLSAGRELSRIDFPTDPKNRPLIAFIGDTHIEVAARHEQVVRIYELAGGREVVAHKGHTSARVPSGRAEVARWLSVAPMLSPDGTRAVLFDNLGAVMSLRIVDARDGRELCADELNAGGFGRARWIGEGGVIVEGLREAGRERVMFLDIGRAKTLSAKAGSVTADERERARAVFLEAFAAFQRGDFDQAVRRFETGLAIDAANAPANYYLGESHLRLGRRAEAMIAFRRAREIAPESREAAQATERLGQLGADGEKGAGPAATLSFADPEQARLLVSQALRRAAARLAIGSQRYGYIDGSWDWNYVDDANIEGLMVATDPKTGDLLIDLDSGNGAVSLYAALRFGLRSVGIQSDPEVARVASEAARALGVADRVSFVAADPLTADLSSATIVTLNGTLRKDPEVNRKWVAKLRALPRTVRIAASRYNEWNWVPDRIVSSPPSGKGYIRSTGLWLGRGE